MKSIRSKMIFLILSGIIVSVTIIGGVGMLSFRQASNKDSAKIMNLTCREKAMELNDVLGRMEQSVEIMSVYATDNFESIERLLSDSAYEEQYIKNLSELGLTIANETDGAVAVWGRLSPEFTTSKSGFFWVKDMETGRFEDCELTDLSQYEIGDTEHVGWYYIPIKAEKAVWMQPYYNQNIDVYMISYVIPVYKDNEFLGVVGMDIDFGYITEKVDSIKVYETGEAYLTNENFEIVHSKSHESGTSVKELGESLEAEKNVDVINADVVYEYTFSGVEKKAAFQILENGMCLAVVAPVSEINAIQNKLMLRIVFIEFWAVIIFACIAWAIARTIVKPLKELDIAAKEIASGNLDVSLTCKSKDEVGALAKSLQETAKQLKIRIDYINTLAYVDKLTGIKNNTAYLQEVSFLNADMQDTEEDFAVFVMDLNGLKEINDNYGHDYGNELIINATKIMAGVFGFKNVYRIGGDEFAVIKKETSFEECRELEREFEEALKRQTGKIRVAAAIGSAVYDKSADSSYERVFRRADGEMYKRKLEMKERGENSMVMRNNLDESCSD